MLKKNALFLILCLSAAVTTYSQRVIIANPASTYAKFMGLESETRTDSVGNQIRVCILPDRSECDEWDFFRGKCGREYSYCALKGCLTQTDSTATSEFAVCICPDSCGSNKRIPLLEFMEQNGDKLIK